MKNGLYKVGFRTPLGYGAGVVVLEDGTLRGGDFAMYYVGTYTVTNGVFVSQVKVRPHSRVPASVSVLGTTEAELNLKGTCSHNTAAAEGTSPQAPGITFTAELNLLE